MRREQGPTGRKGSEFGVDCWNKYENFRCIEKGNRGDTQFHKPDRTDDWRVGQRGSPIVIEGEFDDLQPWERGVPTVAGFVHDDKIRLRVTFSIDLQTSGADQG